MNNDFWFGELKNIYGQIEKTSLNGIDTVCGAVKTVLSLAKTINEQEIDASRINDIVTGDEKTDIYLRYLISFVINNRSAEYIEEMGTYRYIADGFAEYDALACMVYLRGAIGIANKCPEDELCDGLLAGLPDYIRSELE